MFFGMALGWHSSGTQNGTRIVTLKLIQMKKNVNQKAQFF